MRIGLHINRRLRAGIAQILLLAFALRALVPVGYMPDLAALSKGTLQVVICTANGSETVLLDAGGKTHKKTNSHADQPCAFSGLHAAALTASVAEPAKPAIEVSRLKFAFEALLPPARAGPALGSRGPPTLS